MSLQQGLMWIIESGGAGVITYWLIENIAELRDMVSVWKRRVSLVLAAAIAMAAFAAAVGLGYQTMPLGWQAWLEALAAVAGGAIGLSQLIHGERKLPSV